MITFDEYLADPPLLHTSDDGRTWNIGRLRTDHLRLIHQLASAVPQPRIIETGAGNASITFLYTQPACLVSVSPEEELFRQIEGYCIKAGIDASRWDRVVEQSETALPRLMLSDLHQFDIALIDGRLGMPTVFVDFVYMHARLKVGGLLLIDDVQHSARELAKLLSNEPGFTLVRQINKLVVFRKDWDREFIGNFDTQRHVLERTAHYASQSDPFALTVRKERLHVTFSVGHGMHSLLKSIARPFGRAGLNFLVLLTESLIRLAPGKTDENYRILRVAYKFLPFKLERKQYWASQVAARSTLLSELSIKHSAEHLADELARLPDKIYRILRATYRALPVKLERKQYWVNQVIAKSTFPSDLLSDLSIKLVAMNLAGETCWSGDRIGHRALVIEHRLPTPDRTSGSARLSALVKLIREEGWDVTFISDSKKEDYHWVLQNIATELPRYENMLRSSGVSYFYGFEQAVELLKREGATFDLVILSYPEIMHKYAALVRAFAPLAYLVYDTVDLHGLRFSREAAISDEKAELVKRAEYYEHIERAGFQVADMVIAITPNEAEQIVLRCPKVKEPMIISNIHCLGTKVAWSERRTGLLFIGHYLHTPNEDAVCHFVREIYPLIERQIPGIEFTMLGSSITDRVRALGTKTIHAVGYVPDPESYFSKAKVFVAPLRYGAGMKGKIGQALSLGLPIVSTSIGAEGMGLLNERHLLVADDPQAFAAAVVRLYTDSGLWQRMSAAGQDHILNNFTELAIKPAIATLLERASIPLS